MNFIDLENNFFGRKSIIELLKRRVIDLKDGYRQNLAFLGSRFIGKSSIMRKFMRDLEDENIIEIYLDLDNKDFSYFFSKFTGSMLYNFSRQKKLPLHEDLNLLLESTKSYIPHTVAEIKKIRTTLSKGRLNDAYRDLIGLPEIFTLESGKFCMIILDEFHSLAEFSIPNIFQELGKKIMTQKKCIYIVTSSMVSQAEEILSERLSLLFGHFEIITVTAFDFKTSQDFIAHNLEDLRLNTQLRGFLIDFTGGHPLYLNIICQELINLSALHKQNEAFLPLLTHSLENTIFNRWGILSRHFELVLNMLCSGKGNQSVSSVLVALANGKHKLQEIIDYSGLKKNAVSQKLAHLTELCIIVKNGNFYYFQDKFLKYWIKYVYQRRLNSITSDTHEQRRQFRSELMDLFDIFNVVSKQDLSTRIVELLHCFDNEALRLNGRRYKLPSFREVVSLNLGDAGKNDFRIIKASSAEGIWFIILKENELCENDVNIFLNVSKKIKQKLQRRIIISLADLDSNARLKALQEKMWIWNEGEVNALLSLYDKPYIVRT